MISPKLILYSDPNCPFCYALGERLMALGYAEQVEWRGVQHAPMLPIPRVGGNARMNAAIDQEVRAIQHLAPEVPIRTLTGKPNTGPAIRAVAAATRRDPQRGAQLRTNLYRALWQRNEDISDRTVLEDFAKAVGLEYLVEESGPKSDAAAQAVEWEQGWQEIGTGSVPLLVRADGESLAGLVGADLLKEFVEGQSVVGRG